MSSIDHLLVPRYEVIADYPGSRFKIGKIFVCENGIGIAGHGEDVTLESNLRDFPNIFKSLQWWERRQESEMPQCVKHKETNEVFKVEYRSHITPSDAFTNNGWVTLYDCTPATLEEYESYLKSKP